MSKYWQHDEPLTCPEDHPMVWLGSVYWICAKCQAVYVQKRGGATA